MIVWLVAGVLIGLGISVIVGLLILYHLLKDLW